MTMRAPVREALTWGGRVQLHHGFHSWGRVCVAPQSSTQSPSSEVALDSDKGLPGLDGGQEPARAQLSLPRGGPAYHWGVRRVPRPLFF